MASYSQSQKLMVIGIMILSITLIPISSGHRRRWRRPSYSGDTERYLRDVCSETDRSDVCLNILKSNSQRFDSSDEGDIAGGVIDLAREKSQEIGNQLNKWYEDTTDDSMRGKYRSCSENYDEATRYLQDAQTNFDYGRISDLIDSAQQELDQCKRVFASGSFDPGHVDNRNNELALYLDIIRAATARFGY